MILRCWNCTKTYIKPGEVKHGKRFMVRCPHCGAEGVVEIESDQREIKSVMRGEDAFPNVPDGENAFSEIIQTRRQRSER